MALQAYDDNQAAVLLARYRATGDERYREALVEGMRPLVRAQARRFSGRAPLEDLESEGYVGLLRAVERYEPERGARFSTFATHLIAGQIRHYLRDRGHLIRQPAWLQELNSRAQRCTEELERRLGRAPSSAELAEALNVTEESVEELLAARQAAHLLRLDAPQEDGDDRAGFLDVDPEKFRSRAYNTFELPLEDRIVLEEGLQRLRELERDALYYFFYQEFNQSEIARALGISCNYAGHVLRNGLKHLRERLPQERFAAARRMDPAAEGLLDPETGAYARNALEQRLAEDLCRAFRYRQPFSLCVLRLPAAPEPPRPAPGRGAFSRQRTPPSPETLQAAAAVDALRSQIRKADLIGRLGPCELVVLFPNTGEVCGEVTERLRVRLTAVLGRPVSAGYAVFPQHGKTAQQLLRIARQEIATPAAPAEPLPALT